MYHYHNQEPHHFNTYTNLEVAKLYNANTISKEEYHQVLPQNTLQNTTEDSRPQPEEYNNEKTSANTSKGRVKNVKSSVQMPKKPTVDTSSFSIEERLVAAVWVHERKHVGDSINKIKNNFKRRFDRDPPSKTTLFAWERKLFSTGNVSDAPRTGRPVHRKQQIPVVAASVTAAPALSLRARARALGLPRSTLHHILRHDLPHHQHTTNNLNNHTGSKRLRQTLRVRGRSAPAVPSRRRSPPGLCPAPRRPPPLCPPRRLTHTCTTSCTHTNTRSASALAEGTVNDTYVF